MTRCPIPAAYLMLRSGTRILLLRRYNTGYEDGSYSLIAGHLEPGESFTRCIIREAEEEVGIVLAADDVEAVHTMHREPDTAPHRERIDVFFTAKRWQGEILNREPAKCDQLAWFEVSDLPRNTIPYVRFAIDAANRGIRYSEYGWKRRRG